MTAEPTATLIASPAEETLTLVVSELAHVTARCVNTFPAESLVVAANCTALPTRSVSGDGATVTDATAGGPEGWAVKSNRCT